VPTGQAREAFLDQRQIEQQWVLPTFAISPISFVRRERPGQTGRILRSYKRWVGDTLADSQRLWPVVAVDLKTMPRDEVRGESARCWADGARSVLFRPSPVDGKSLAHPDYDWFRAACSDQGVMPIIHVGSSRPSIDLGWLNNGRSSPFQLVCYLGSSTRYLTSCSSLSSWWQVPSSAAPPSGCWLPNWAPTGCRPSCGGPTAWRKGRRGWGYPMLPSEYLRRNVRISPLHADPTAEVIDAAGHGSDRALLRRTPSRRWIGRPCGLRLRTGR